MANIRASSGQDALLNGKRGVGEYTRPADPEVTRQPYPWGIVIFE